MAAAGLALAPPQKQDISDAHLHGPPAQQEPADQMRTQFAQNAFGGLWFRFVKVFGGNCRDERVAEELQSLVVLAQTPLISI